MISTQTRSILAVAFGAGCAATCASAETVLSVFLGTTRTRDSDLKVEQPATASDATFKGVGWDGKDRAAPPYYGLRATHFLESAPNWGIGFEFIHYKVYADAGRAVPVEGKWNGAPVNETAPLGSRVQNFSISHGVNLLALDAIYRFNVDPPRPGFPTAGCTPTSAPGR